MDILNKFVNMLLTSARERPKATVFLVTIGFLAFALYGAMFMSTDGVLVLSLYVALAIGAFAVIGVLLICEEQDKENR